jgi:hypothetical protein
MSFASREGLPTTMREIVTDIPQKTLHPLFDDWMERAERVSEHNGDYCP